jgi:hypothetical protein
VEDLDRGARSGPHGWCISLRDPRADAEAYHAMHAKRLAARGVTGIEATYRGVNETLSLMDRAPLG